MMNIALNGLKIRLEEAEMGGTLHTSGGEHTQGGTHIKGGATLGSDMTLKAFGGVFLS